MPHEFLNCTHGSICAGCDWLKMPMAEQVQAKTAHLRSTLPFEVGEVTWRSGGPRASRDRFDFMIDRRSGDYRVGLFNQTRDGLANLDECPQLSPRLEAWFKEFRQIEFPIERGSVRLRVAPDGTRGVWLDFANVDVKTLLDERTTLDRLIATKAIIEIGQRRKRLVEREGRLRLDDPVLYPWFETSVHERKISLYCTIGSFTQPGFRVNQLLVEEVVHLAGRVRSLHSETSRAAEFGSGIGNFTLPLSELFASVDAYEVDRLALEGLERSLEHAHRRNVTIHSGNYQGDKALPLDFSDVDLLFVDPPRSGLMKFIEPIVASKPRAVLYVSCFAESFALDSKRLLDAGYRLESLTIVDQFPQTKHYETVALFTLKA